MVERAVRERAGRVRAIGQRDRYPREPVQTAEGHTYGRPDPIDVLESEDGKVRVHVNGRYIGHAPRRFKGAQFFASSEKWRPRVSVHHKGEIVGVIMGILVD